MPLTDTHKQIALIEELDASARLIRLGFGELQNLDAGNDFYFLPFQLLSQGFERFMKSYICLGYMHRMGDYPTKDQLKNLGHDLEKLLHNILNQYFNAHVTPLLREDRDFLQNNSELKELLYILSEFGRFARYYNFDIIAGARPSINPKKRWSEFESEVIFANPDISAKLLDYELSREVRSYVSRYTIEIFERYIGALTRQILHNGLGSDAKRFISSFFEFALFDRKTAGNTY